MIIFGKRNKKDMREILNDYGDVAQLDKSAAPAMQRLRVRAPSFPRNQLYLCP